MSPDYLNPSGCVKDNHTNAQFIWEIDNFFQGQPYRLLDIGCVGGKFAIDVYHKGAPWLGIGLEGGNIHGMTNEFDPKEAETETITIARGSENWKNYKDKCLFHADVSKPFTLLGEHDEVIKFDIVTAWEFFEHPTPDEIPLIIENIKRHLKPLGVVIATINLSPGDHHQCAKPREWWDEIFRSHGFVVAPYPFNSSPRASGVLALLKDLSFEDLRTLNINFDGPITPRGVIDATVYPSEFNYPVCFILRK